MIPFLNFSRHIEQFKSTYEEKFRSFLDKSHYILGEEVELFEKGFTDYCGCSFGELGCFSFYPTKNLGCFGDGGMVITNNEDHYNKLRLLRNYGQKNRYETSIIGFNSRLDELQAAILREKLKNLDVWNKRRRAIAGLYNQELSQVPECLLPAEEKHCYHVYHLYVIKIPDRDNVQQKIYQNGVQTLIHYPISLHLQPAFHFLGYEAGEFPVTEDLCRHILSLPIYPELQDSEVEKIASTVRSVLLEK